MVDVLREHRLVTDGTGERAEPVIVVRFGKGRLTPGEQRKRVAGLEHLTGELSKVVAPAFSLTGENARSDSTPVVVELARGNAARGARHRIGHSGAQQCVVLERAGWI